MENLKHQPMIKVRHLLTIAQQVLGLILLALEIYEHIQNLF